jgi:hypothetical protein
MKNTEPKTDVEIPSKTYFDTQTNQWLFTDEEMKRQRAELRRNVELLKEDCRKRGYIINPIQM